MGKKLTKNVVQRIDQILQNAHARGRETLFEHEVYGILAVLGMMTPPHFAVRDEAEITNNLLMTFGSEKIVLKVAAQNVPHKQRAGGVKVVYKDLDFIRYHYRKMKRTFGKTGAGVDSILFAEYVAYTKDLGNEILLGFRESDAFGPVLSFSKGGSDAEHFAAHYSAPNLILPPIDQQWARALLESTKIQKKYRDEGKTGYMDAIVDAHMKFSHLATAFSNFFDGDTAFVITEFEVNPFVFDPEGRFFALDGFARFEPRKAVEPDLALRPQKTLVPFFEPNGIGVVGISTTDNAKPGNIIVKNLINMGREDIYGFNPKGGDVHIAGRRFPLSKSLDAVEGAMDLVIITVPAEAVGTIIRDCVKKGVGAVILISGGFSEVQKNLEIEAAIRQLVNEEKLRILGPNCLGVVYAGNRKNKGINTFFIPEEKFTLNLEREKNVAILTQSGALGIMEIYNLRNAISPKVIVSYGNQLDVDLCDLVYYFQKDPMVDVIGCYIEGFKRGGGRKLFNIAAKGRKPVIAYKAGRTEAGRKATQSHTASIAGEYEVAKAAMKQAGMIVADTMIDHGDFIKTFALLDDFTVTGNRVAIIANAGYEKTYAADNLEDLVPAAFDKKTVSKLAAVLPGFVAADPLLDLTPMADDQMFERCIEIVLQSDAVDALFISIVPQSAVIHTTDEEIDRNKENLAARIVRIVHQYKKPTAVSINVVSGSDAVYNRLGQTLDSGGVPTFLTAKRAMVCLNAFIRYHITQKGKMFSEWLK